MLLLSPARVATWRYEALALTHSSDARFRLRLTAGE